jgi:hypothetical protein
MRSIGVLVDTCFDVAVKLEVGFNAGDAFQQSYGIGMPLWGPLHMTVTRG